MVDSDTQRRLDAFLEKLLPALKHGLAVDFTFLVLTALMLDGGRSARIYVVAFIGHWLFICFIILCRPITKVNLFFIRWGVLILWILVGFFAPVVPPINGEGPMSGSEELSSD
jgi:hypothetical protein